MTFATPSKAELRKDRLRARNALSMEARIEASLAAAAHALDSAYFGDGFMPGTMVAGYHPIRSEMDPRPLMADLAARGARLCLPVVTGETSMEFRELLRGGAMVESGFGTVGPDENAAVVEPDIIILPLSCFDGRGGRIGYGAGFYDRAVEKLSDRGKTPLLLGLAFALQRVAQIPVEDHDRALAAIITETGVIAARP